MDSGNPINNDSDENEEDNYDEEENEAEKPIQSSFSCKIVLAGSSGVGKTSIVNRAFERDFSNYEPTIGVGFRKGVIKMDGREITMEVWDTAGQEKYNSMVPVFFKNAACAILVYDITNKASFQVLNDVYIPIIRDQALSDCLIVVVGNKVDLTENQTPNPRQVTFEEVDEFCELVDAAFNIEVSALTGYGIDTIFKTIASNQNIAKMKSVYVKMKPEIRTIPIRRPKRNVIVKD